MKESPKTISNTLAANDQNFKKHRENFISPEVHTQTQTHTHTHVYVYVYV